MEILNQHQQPNYHPPQQENKKVLAGILALLFGGLGVHKFVLGYNTEGILILVANFVIIPIFGFATCGLGWFLYVFTYIFPFVEGIIYLTKTDEEFYQTYQVNKRPWF